MTKAQAAHIFFWPCAALFLLLNDTAMYLFFTFVGALLSDFGIVTGFHVFVLLAFSITIGLALTGYTLKTPESFLSVHIGIMLVGVSMFLVIPILAALNISG